MNYDDISLIPQYFSGASRSEMDTSVKFGPRTFKLPVIPANMKCCIDFELAQWMSENDYFYILHRFYDYDDVEAWLAKNKDLKTLSISVGVKDCDKKFLKRLAGNGIRVDYITIDIAHGHCRAMNEMISFIKSLDFGYWNPENGSAMKWRNYSPFIIAGNVGTADGANDLFHWGADCTKIGVGPGAACTTKLKTGFHTPMFSIMRAVKFGARDYTNDFIDPQPVKKKYYIADGGIKHNGDIAKALVAGATMTMAGRMFTECCDSPADSIYNYKPIDNKPSLAYKSPIQKEKPKIIQKRYYGSASAKNKGHNNNVEGKEIILDCNGMTYEDKLREIQQDLQSAMSYGGCDTLRDFSEVQYLHIS